MVINKEVQQLAQSTIYSYDDALIIYDHYKDIEVTRFILQLLAVGAIPIETYVKLLNDGIDVFSAYNYLKEP